MYSKNVASQAKNLGVEGVGRDFSIYFFVLYFNIFILVRRYCTLYSVHVSKQIEKKKRKILMKKLTCPLYSGVLAL